MKQDIFGNQNVPSLEVQNEFKGSRHKTLIKQTEYWQDIIKVFLLIMSLCYLMHKESNGTSQ